MSELENRESSEDSNGNPSMGTAEPENRWETQARENQQLFLEMFGGRTYDSYRTSLPSICNLLLIDYCKCLETDSLCKNDSELKIMKKNIGFALFGPPKSMPSSGTNVDYSEKEIPVIDKIFNQIVREQTIGGRVLMAPLYVFLEGKNGANEIIAAPVPVFRIPNGDQGQESTDDFWFVDHLGRRYKSWEGFLTSNKLPSSRLCFPKNGVYTEDSSGNVEVCFGYTPAASLSSTVLTSADRASTVAGFGAGAVGIGIAISPVLAPLSIPCVVVGGCIGIYGMARGSFELADRGRHGESLADRESFRHWISVAGSCFGFASSGGMAMVQFLARQGRNASVLVTGIVTGLNYSSLAVNGISIAESFCTILEEGKWSPLQLFQFSASVMFFAFSVVNTKTARSVYQETQSQILDDHRDGLRSNRHRKLFDGIQKETLKGEPDAVAAKAKIIRDINHISNKDEFYARVLRSNKAARKISEPVEKVKFGEFHHENGETAKFGNLFVKNVNASGHTSSNFTIGNKSPQLPIKSTNYYNLKKEPGILSAIEGFMSTETFRSSMQHLLHLLEIECRKFRYGKYFMKALRIVMDCFHCKNSQDAIFILQEVINISRDLWQERCREREEIHEMSLEGQNSENQSSETYSSEEVMDEVMMDVGFIPQLLFAVEVKKELDVGEQVFHFPDDHRMWGEINGELTPDEYILISQNVFGIANVECANIIHEGSTASVYFEHVGLVTITSFREEQKIVVKKISFTE